MRASWLCVVVLGCGTTGTKKPGTSVDTADSVDSGATVEAGGPAMVAATSGAEAIAAGLAVLDEGGHAVDAALTVANVQIVRSMGSWNSFAGIMGMVVYDAETGEVTSLHGNYATFVGETDPATIPAGPSGRTALVPGYMATAEAAHAAYGVLPWSRTLEPAIELAETGFALDALFAGYLTYKEALLRRRPETEALFTDADGNLLEEGDVFRQPALAETLRSVSTDGAAYMYTGAWADRFVAAVQEEGGRVEAADLAGYSPDWLTPLEGTYAGARVVTLGTREFGGVQILEGLHMAEAMDLAALGPWWESGEAMYRLARITQVNQLWTYLYDYNPDYERYVTDAFPGVTLDHAARVDPAQGALMADYVDDGTFAEFAELLGLGVSSVSHSDAIVVVDRAGNAVALTHTINTTLWGDTGIFVDGVSVPDSASFQQDLLDEVAPGGKVPTPLNCLVALRDGRLVLTASTIGNVHYAQLQRTHAVLGLGMSPEDAVQAPMVEGALFSELVARGAVDAAVLEEAAALGTPIAESSASTFPAWVGISVADDGGLAGGAEPFLEAIGGGVGALPAQ